MSFEGIDEGEASRHQYGASVMIVPDQVDHLRVYFTTHKGEKFAELNAMVLHRESASDPTSKYSFDKKDVRMLMNIVEHPVDIPKAADLQMAIAGDDLLFKSAHETQLHTIKSCSLTEVYVPPDEDEIEENPLTSRLCVQCPSSIPYSGGFMSTRCYSCDWLLENNETFAHQKLCPQDADPKPDPDEPDEPIDSDTGKKEDDEEIKDPEEEEEEKSGETATPSGLIYRDLDPLEEEPWSFQPIAIFLWIVVPALVLYFCYVIWYRKKRAARKQAEQEQRAQAMQELGQGPFETEAGLNNGCDTERNTNKNKEPVVVAFNMDSESNGSQDQGKKQKGLRINTNVETEPVQTEAPLATQIDTPR